MLNLLFYQPAEQPPVTLEHLAEVLAYRPGLSLEEGTHYRAGRWRDPATGATCEIDLGHAPLEEDHLHPPKSYNGWRDTGLAVHLPLAGPHWLCVEVLQWVEGLLQRLGDVRALDTEDTRQEHGDGPGTWNRPRVLGSWERLHQAQAEGRTDLWRMARLPSVCLWRYRREREGARQAHADLRWPEALVLLDRQDQCARSAVVWPGPGNAFALPPVELVVITDGTRAGAFPAERLSALGGEPLSLGQAQRVRPTPATDALFATTDLMPPDRFRALGDHDWTD
jgi:hypothetical protein